jgi:hypothetical protein
MQMGGSDLDIEVFVLTGSALRRQHAAAVYVFEISIRKLISPLGLLVLGIVDSQVPSSVRSEPMLPNELILLLC